jgi:hypothetical protein
VAVKEIRFVFFAARPRKARSALAGAGVDADADVTERSGFAHCRVKLDAADPRLPELLARVEKLGETVLVRAERIWSKRELDAAERLLLRVATAGLDGGLSFGQQYDRSAACRTCGSGAIPLPPLPADLPRMGRKHLDATAYDGLLVVSTALAASLDKDGVTGYELEPVRSRSERYPTDRHRWLNVTAELPPCRSDSVFVIDDPCPTCARSGHFSSYKQPTDLRYDALPAGTPDLARTYEYWGYWRAVPPAERVGGNQRVVVSQKVRRTFLRVGVRQARFDPLDTA